MNRRTLSKGARNGLLFTSFLCALTFSAQGAQHRVKRFLEPYKVVEQGELSWIAQLTNEFGNVCTVFLVSDRHVVTAAHCFWSNYSKKEMEVLFRNSEGERRRVIRYILHHNRVPISSSRYDIAIVELDYPLYSITPANVNTPWANPMPSSLDSIRNTMSAGYAAQTQLKLVEHLTWIHYYRNGKYVSPYYRVKYTGIAEKGDSGSPLFYKEKNEYYALGILSTNMQNMNWYCSLWDSRFFIDNHLELEKVYSSDNSTYSILGTTKKICDWIEIPARETICIEPTTTQPVTTTHQQTTATSNSASSLMSYESMKVPALLILTLFSLCI